MQLDDEVNIVLDSFGLYDIYLLLLMQAVLPRRADPTELKAIFEKVNLYFSILILYFAFSVCGLSKKIFTMPLSVFISGCICVFVCVFLLPV